MIFQEARLSLNLFIKMKSFTEKILFIFLLTSFAASTAKAQQQAKQYNEQSQSWVSINSTVRLSSKFGFIADAHMRRNNFAADPSFYFLRGAFNYWLTDKITLAAGYGNMWVAPTKPGWKHYGQEHRIYQQAQMISKVGKINMMNRLRNEQRWQEKIANDKFTHQFKFTDRIRYLLSFTVPLSKNKYVPALVLSDELAVQFGKEVVYNTFDQNRVFMGIKQNVCKNLSFDLGYMLLTQQKATGYQYDKNHTFRWFFYYTPDLRKKK